MSLWGLDKRPTWFPDAFSTSSGWVNPATGEILVAIRGLSLKRREYIQRPQANLLLSTGGGLLLLNRQDDNRPNFLLL